MTCLPDRRCDVAEPEGRTAAPLIKVKYSRHDVRSEAVTNQRLRVTAPSSHQVHGPLTIRFSFISSTKTASPFLAR